MFIFVRGLSYVYDFFSKLYFSKHYYYYSFGQFLLLSRTAKPTTNTNTLSYINV